MELLKNIKPELGTIVFEGNKTKAEIAISVRTYFYLGGFELTADNIPEATLRNSKLPIWMLGLSDYYSSFSKSEILLPTFNKSIELDPGVLFQHWIRRPRVLEQFNAAIYGYNCYDQYLGIPAGNRNPVQPGDMYFWFSGELPTFLSGRLALVVLHCPDIAYGTFLNSFVSDLITIDRMKMIIPTEVPAYQSINQFINPIHLAKQDLFGVTLKDTIDPRLFITSRDAQQQICDIPLNLSFDKDLIMAFYLDVLVQSVDIVFYISKVEPLTYKS